MEQGKEKVEENFNQHQYYTNFANEFLKLKSEAMNPMKNEMKETNE